MCPFCGGGVVKLTRLIRKCIVCKDYWHADEYGPLEDIDDEETEPRDPHPC